MNVVLSSLGGRHSRLRGWLVGGGIAVLLWAVLGSFEPFVHQHEWVAWGPVALGIWLGYRAWEHPNPFATLTHDVRRITLVVVALAALVLGVLFLPGLINGVIERLIPTDVPGLARLTLGGFVGIAWMLITLARSLDRLNDRRGE